MTSSSSLDRALTLHVLLPDETEREFFVQQGLTIGRTGANTICIDHPDVERIHARVSAQPDGSMVLECQTDQARLLPDGGTEPLSRLALAPGTRFQIGSALLTCGSWQARATVRMAGSLWQVRCPRCHASLADLPYTAKACPQCSLAIKYHDAPGNSQQNAPASFAGWLPSRVGPYAIRSFIAEGGMGVVLRGLHQEDDKFAAVKLLRQSEDDDAKAEARFAEEVANLAKCVHPNIVRLQDSGRDQRLIWLALDWVDGSTLQTYIANLKLENEVTSIDRIADWMGQIVKGLSYLHERGIIHRDLKPGNVLVTAEGLVKIADFSIAKTPLAGMTSMTRTGAVAGSAGYMSPEQWEGRRIGPETDVFSLGIVWYELLTHSRLVGTYQSVRTRRCDCPPEWDSLILRCLHFDTAKRPRLGEIAHQLDATIASPRPPVPRLVAKSDRYYIYVCAAIAILGSALIVFGYSFSRDNPPNRLATVRSAATELETSIPAEPELDSPTPESWSPNASTARDDPQADSKAPPPFYPGTHLLSGPTASDRSTALAVAKLMSTEHLTRRPLDDEISHRTLKGFIKLLDPAKVYFYQSDVDSLMGQANELDDELKSGDIQFSYVVFNTLLKRIDERLHTIDELLGTEHNFTVDEDIVIDPDATSYPRDPAEARELWRKRIKYDLLVLKTETSARPSEGPRQRSLQRRYHSFAKRMHETDHEELLEMYLNSMTAAYDPHSKYISPRGFENSQIASRLDMEGIGATLEFEDGYTVVKRVVPGSPAEKDGRLRPEDRIVGIGQGAEGPIVDTINMKLSDVVDMIRGKRGTTVRLEVISTGDHDRRVYNIVRDKVVLAGREARGETVERKRDGKKYLIGIIDLPSFYMDRELGDGGVSESKSAGRDVTRILRDFRAKGADCVVLDLRRNGGGSLLEGIGVTGLFLDQGPIVQVKDKNGNVTTYKDNERGTEWDGPLVVITSKQSAGASEVLAGAVQDYRRGIVVGDKATHGMGTVRSLLDLGKQLFQSSNSPKLGALDITQEQYYRPGGDSTQIRGVLSDVVLPSMTNALEGIGESDLDFALPFDRVTPASHERLSMVANEMVEQLNLASAKRREMSDGFRKLARDIERYQWQKNRKTITLNEAKFMAERGDLNTDVEDGQVDDPSHARQSAFDTKSYYNQEVLEITLDYLQLAKRVAR